MIGQVLKFSVLHKYFSNFNTDMNHVEFQNCAFSPSRFQVRHEILYSNNHLADAQITDLMSIL